MRLPDEGPSAFEYHSVGSDALPYFCPGAPSKQIDSSLSSDNEDASNKVETSSTPPAVAQDGCPPKQLEELLSGGGQGDPIESQEERPSQVTPGVSQAPVEGGSSEMESDQGILNH